MPLYVCWIVAIICSLFSMFFSSADMVYSVVNKVKLEKLVKKGNKKAKVALKLANDYEFTIASILFGNNVANIFASSVITVIGTVWNKEWGASVATIIFTIVLIIIAEFLPKAFSKRFSFSLSLIYAYPVDVIKKITFIVVWPISKLFVLIGKLFKKKSIEEDIVDEDILTEMVETMEDEGNLDADEAELVKSAIDLTDTQAFEIMTPRVDVFAIDADENIEDILSNEEIYTHTRIPVYRETIDNIIGILPIKALAKAKFNKEKIDMLSLCYQPLVIPRNHQLLDLLEEFKKSKIHIAVVKDEYGGTEGIITMEDILEEIVGDIFDETDEVEEEFIDKGDGHYLVDGMMNIDDFFELIEYKGEFETDYSTVGGLVQEVLDRFAKIGDKFTFAERYECEVIDAEEFTVEKLKVFDTQYNKEVE